jgi:type IV secretory pathway TrbF-like protein
MRLKSARRSRAIETAALDGKTNHETLYGAIARRAHGYKLCIYLLAAVLVWDRIERWPLLAEKQYLPVVLERSADGSLSFAGEPNPLWRPEDISVLGELAWAIQTLRGRTKDKQFDDSLWQRLYDRSTDTARFQLQADYEALQSTPEKGRITVHISTVNKLSDASYDIRWEEKRENLTGAVVGIPLRYRGVFTVRIEVPKTLATWRKHQGVLIEGWSIAEEKL